MDAPPSAPSTGRSSLEPRAGTATRLRTSCDACQNVKMKCSQDKPSCHRCRKNGLACVYSPLRRMGRPRTKTRRPIETPGLHETESWLVRDTGLGHGVVASDGSAAGGAVPAAEGMDGVVSGAMEEEQQPETHQTLTMLAAAEDMAAGGYGPNGLLHSSTSAAQQYWHAQPPLLGPPDVMDMNLPFSATQKHVEGLERAREEHDDEGGQGNCYIRILQRLTQLEQVLERSSPLPPLDIILSAERDTRVLKDALFACGGHSPQPSSSSGGSSSSCCLQAHGSSLVVLVLLADRVTSLLEGLFDHAAARSYGMHRALETSSASLLLGASPPPPGQLSGHRGEWRVARSLRGAYPRSISCPVPEASCRLTVGGYEVDGEVESRVMKHILRRRVRALQRMLGEVEEHTAEPASATLVGGDRGQVAAARRGLGPPMARAKVLDLRRRVELLQGRLELAE